MRIAVVQLAYGDEEPFEERVDRVAGLVAEQAGHDLVVLPGSGAPPGSATPAGPSRPSRSTARGWRRWRMPHGRPA